MTEGQYAGDASHLRTFGMLLFSKTVFKCTSKELFLQLDKALGAVTWSTVEFSSLRMQVPKRECSKDSID